MKNKKLYLFLIPLFILIFGVFALPNSIPYSNPNSASSITYGSNVCKQVIRADGTRETPECSHNVLYTTGKNLIRDYLGDSGGGTDEVDTIVLCNANDTGAGCGVPVADSSEAFEVFVDCGLSESADSDYDALLDGNWTISHEFTSTCNGMLVNSTRLINTANVEFAANNFTLATLQTDDKLLVNWSIYVV